MRDSTHTTTREGKTKSVVVFAFSLLLSASLAAAPSGKGADPVAAGFPAWEVPGGKAHVQGRPICASDLRHKITVIVEFDAAKAKDQLPAIASFARFMPAYVGSSVDWAHMSMRRDVMVVFSNVGAKNDAAIVEGMKSNDKAVAQKMSIVKQTHAPIYDGVTFPGAPANEGKLPFAYVMGPTGTEPLYKGAADYAAVSKAVTAAKKDLPEWKPFCGSVTEPQFVGKDVAAAVAKGKPLAAVATKAKKGVLAHDAAQAKESQIVYDALEQTRSDLEFRISLEATAAPYRAAYDLEQLVKYWPASKKRVEQWAAKIKATPEFAVLGKAFSLCMKYNDPDFTCKNAGEAKKCVAELTKLKKAITPMKDAKVIAVQNAALIVDGELESTIAALPTKVAGK